MVCSFKIYGDCILMTFADGKISTLAKLLEPYLRQQIRELLGPISAKNLHAKTYIQGGEFPQEDKAPESYLYPGTQTGEDAVALSAQIWDWDASETAQADRSAVIGYFSATTEPAATDSIAWGWDGKCYKNPCSVSGGFEMYDKFESQAARYTESKKIVMSSSWQTVANIYSREFMHVWAWYEDLLWNTSGFHAYVSGIEVDAQRSYAYKITATTKLRYGSMSLLQSEITTLYESDSNLDIRVVANDTSDSLEFQVIDSGNSGRSVKWCIHVRTSEAIGTSAYHDDW